MPASYHRVSPNIWNRDLRNASGDAQRVLFYVLTCRVRNSEGLFDLSAAQVALDTGMREDDVLAALDELERLDLVSYDPDAEVVLDRQALRLAGLVHGVNERTGEVQRNRAMRPAVARVVSTTATPLKLELYRIAVEIAPHFAEELGLADPSLTIPEAPRQALPSPSEAPSKGDTDAAKGDTQGDPPGGVEKSGAEKSGGEGDGTGDTRPACGYCTAWPSRPDGPNRVLDYLGVPWCGECEPDQAVAS